MDIDHIETQYTHIRSRGFFMNNVNKLSYYVHNRVDGPFTFTNTELAASKFKNYFLQFRLLSSRNIISILEALLVFPLLYFVSGSDFCLH